MRRGDMRLLKTQKRQFDANPYIVEQLTATSEDGTAIPYFLVRSREFHYDSQHPTILYAYGSAGASEFPQYSGILGRLWLARQGVYVVANVRGGGELGEAWHVVKTDRRHVYEDCIAVARDLFTRHITAPSHLGIRGASAGGLLAGVMITQHPESFNAALVEVPVLDLLRPDLLLGGAAAQEPEHGSLSIAAERAFLESTSPLENLRPNEHFPVPMIVTSTADDNVSPAYARKFAAKMDALGMPFFFYETKEGGHGIWATPNEHAQYEALAYTYFSRRLAD
jgi:prolyl oligopeptidase